MVLLHCLQKNSSTLSSKKFEPCFVLWSFFLLRLLFLSINLPYDLAWNISFWAGAPSCYFDMLDNLQKRIWRTVSPSLVASLEPLAYRENVANLSLFYRYLVDVHLNQLNWFCFLILVPGPLVILVGCIIFLFKFQLLLLYSELNEVSGNYVWILKWVNLHCN